MLKVSGTGISYLVDKSTRQVHARKYNKKDVLLSYHRVGDAVLTERGVFSEALPGPHVPYPDGAVLGG
jgi:hypothetical protein